MKRTTEVDPTCLGVLLEERYGFTVGVDLARPGSSDYSAVSALCECGTVVSTTLLPLVTRTQRELLAELEAAVVGHDPRPCPACAKHGRPCMPHDCAAWKASNARGRRMGTEPHLEG